jgi:hypothetical protein
MKLKGKVGSATASDRALRGLADAREDDSEKLVNLLLGMNALWILFRLERDTSLQTERARQSTSFSFSADTQQS